MGLQIQQQPIELGPDPERSKRLLSGTERAWLRSIPPRWAIARSACHCAARSPCEWVALKRAISSASAGRKAPGSARAQPPVDEFEVRGRQGGLEHGEEDPRLGGEAFGERLQHACPAYRGLGDPDAAPPDAVSSRISTSKFSSVAWRGAEAMHACSAASPSVSRMQSPQPCAEPCRIGIAKLVCQHARDAHAQLAGPVAPQVRAATGPVQYAPHWPSLHRFLVRN